jgi:hypothetical protein
LSLRPFYPVPSNLLFTTCFTTSSSLSSSLSPFFSILTPYDNITGKRREVMRWQIERNEGWRGGEED